MEKLKMEKTEGIVFGLIDKLEVNSFISEWEMSFIKLTIQKNLSFFDNLEDLVKNVFELLCNMKAILREMNDMETFDGYQNALSKFMTAVDN